jgi:single-strand DNA-binding protein
MANEQLITVTGRLTSDPELRFTPSGSAVANFTIAFTPSRFDRNANAWKDGTPTFWRCAAWNQGKLTRAENVCDMLKKGDNVIAQGALETRKWEDKEGNERSSIELNVQAIGKDNTFHSQAHQKPAADQGWNGNQTPAQDDPWATPPAANTGGWPAQEPPF